MKGWMELLGLIALIALLVPGMWELKLIDKAIERIRGSAEEGCSDHAHAWDE
jgi:FtsZ-interacting cell division protein ZipA